MPVIRAARGLDADEEGIQLGFVAQREGDGERQAAVRGGGGEEGGGVLGDQGGDVGREERGGACGGCEGREGDGDDGKPHVRHSGSGLLCRMLRVHGIAWVAGTRARPRGVLSRG